MTANRPKQFWHLFVVLLLAVTIIVGTIMGGLTAWSRYRPGEPIEISLPPDEELQGNASTPDTSEKREPQKIDINRADVWLLEALPEIGPVLAQAIVDYREKNGPFRSINELTKVKGIGSTILEQIKDLITVAD